MSQITLSSARGTYLIHLPDSESDYIQKTIVKTSQPYEHEMLQDMAARLQAGDLFVDVGANIGNHSLYVASLGCLVMAFEPNTQCFSALTESIRVNSFEELISVNTSGVGKEFGRANLIVNDPSNIGANSLSLVEEGDISVIALDSVEFPKKISVLKIDVEGMEWEVLQGAEQTLQMYRPLIYVECQDHRRFRTVFNHLSSREYYYWDTFNATPTHLFVPIEYKSEIQMQSRMVLLSSEHASQNKKSIGNVNRKIISVHESLTTHKNILLEIAGGVKAVSSEQSKALLELLTQQTEYIRQLRVVELQAQESREAFNRVLAETERKALERQADFDEKMAAAVEKEAVCIRKLQETERKASREIDRAGKLNDALRTVTAERDRLEAVGQAQLYYLQREAQNAWANRAAQVFKDVGTLSSFALLPFKLNKLRRKAKQRPSSSLGGNSFSAILTAHADGGFDKVEALFTKASSSHIVKADGYTVLARHLKNIDNEQACEAARRAYEEDPRLYRRKWLAFRLYEAKNIVEADIVLGTLPEDLVLSPSESACAKTIRAAAKAKHAGHANSDVSRRVKQKKKAPILAETGGRKLRIAAIMDSFTRHCYAPEADIIHLHPEHWERQFAEFKPDLIFIESAWEGLDGVWKYKVYSCSPELRALLDAAYHAGIPSLFWNKEDPAHYGTFLPVASLVDYVFTTDMDCIPRYREAIGHNNVFLLPFAAQPKHHNPIEKYTRKNAFCYAGSYNFHYLERQHNLRTIIDVAASFLPVEIYDRNHNDPRDVVKFPPEYADMILGSLNFQDIDLAYKGYRFSINMNSIKLSQTMFARRVFELMACNTLIVSNYAHGVSLFFGDLLLASDSEHELQKTLQLWMSDEIFCRKLRLLSLRKVMREHTYARRLAYICTMLGSAVSLKEPEVFLLAKASTTGQAAAIKAGFDRQTYKSKCLILWSEPPCEETQEDVKTVTSLEEVKAILNAAASDTLFGLLAAEDYYGPNYLTDLVLAFGYADEAQACGKGAFYRADGEDAILENDGQQYSFIASLPARASLIRHSVLDERGLLDIWEKVEDAIFQPQSSLALDEFNYVRDGGATLISKISELADDLYLPDQGIELDALLSVTEKLPSAPPVGTSADVLVLDASTLYAHLLNSFSSADNIQGELTQDTLRIRSRLKDGKFKYLTADKIFSREELNLENNSWICLSASGDLDVKTVFEFLDADGNKLSHSIRVAGHEMALPIPGNCVSLRIGLRVCGTGEMVVERLELGAKAVPATLFALRSPYLVLTKQYPSHDDLYRYGFLHTRVWNYKKHGLLVDVFRLSPQPSATSYHAYDGVEVVTGGKEQLESTLRSGQVKHVLVHLLDPRMWDILQNYLDKIKVTIWVHGAEIATWQRRLYNFEQEGAEEIERQKILSAQRMAMWHAIIDNPHPNVHLVFVSKSLQNEAITDLALQEFPRDITSVIHNFIDGDLFTYSQKTPEQRLRILMHRPFSSNKYATDLSVKAILELSKRPFFQELSFHIVGSGPLFEEITEPLRAFDNVYLEKRFLPLEEMISLYHQFGVFLIPTRHDAQGVSRDEAMATGLVPITTNVAAIPEFVDESCGLLVPPEDPTALADAVEILYHDPDLFLRLSKAAAERVRRQCGFEQTIEEDMKLIQRV